MPTTPSEPPRQILKSRPDWASGVASTAGRRELVTHWVGGRRISLGDDVPLGQHSETLAALLEEVIGVPVETVKRSVILDRSVQIRDHPVPVEKEVATGSESHERM